VALFVVTGSGVRERVEALKEKGEYLRSHALAATALELAEATAEWLHARLRTAWGIPDPPDMTLSEMFRTATAGCASRSATRRARRSRTRRRSFRLLEPERIACA